LQLNPEEDKKIVTGLLLYNFIVCTGLRLVMRSQVLNNEAWQTSTIGAGCLQAGRKLNAPDTGECIDLCTAATARGNRH
jgi:hypothetical protein